MEVSQLRVRQVETEKQQRRAQHLQLLTQGLLVKEMANCGRGGKTGVDLRAPYEARVRRISCPGTPARWRDTVAGCDILAGSAMHEESDWQIGKKWLPA